MLGVARIVLELVILRHCRVPHLNRNGGKSVAHRRGESVQNGTLSGPAGVRSYPTFPPPIKSELFDTVSESDPSQSQQIAGRLKLPKPPGARAV